MGALRMFQLRDTLDLVNIGSDLFPPSLSRYTHGISQRVTILLRKWVDIGQDLTLEHFTPPRKQDQAYRLNNAQLFLDNGYPWDYRSAGVNDDILLGLVAEQGCVLPEGLSPESLYL